MQSQRTDGGGDCPTLRGVGETETNIDDIETKDRAKDSHDVTSGLNDPGQDGSATEVVTVQPQYSQSQMMSPSACPPGLDVLLDTGQVVIHKANLRHNTVIKEDAVSRLEVIDEMRHLLFYIEQDPPPNGEHSFMFRFYNSQKTEVAQVYNPVSSECVCGGASWHWFKRCKFSAIVYAPPGVIAGFIRRSHTLFVQEYEILGPHEDILLLLRGGPADLEIYTPDLDDEIGRLSVHGWCGIMHEIRRSAHDYGLTFPLDLDIRVKVVLLAAVFALDWVCGPKPHPREPGTTHQEAPDDGEREMT
ncbi:Phospholipid scramblase 2 [Lamellibrachia satsuma]|nr:Phospholipid scramblase 2 [Lamellibrachia satsuma]